MLRVALVISFLILCTPAIGADNSFRSSIGMKIYFYQFQTVTYAPITLKDIVNASEYRIDFYEKHAFIHEIKKLLTKSPSKMPFDKKNVRLRVEILSGKKAEVYGVDSTGGVFIEKSRKSYRLSRDDMQHIQDKIIGFHGVVDRHPDFNPDGSLSE